MAPFLGVTPISRVIDGEKSLWVIDSFLFSRRVNLIAVPIVEAASLGQKGLMDLLVSLFPPTFPKLLSANLAAIGARPFLLIGANLFQVLSAILTLVFPVVRTDSIASLRTFLPRVCISSSFVLIGHGS
jgi:hypothetical protein